MTEEKELHVPFLDSQGRIWCDRLNTTCNGKNGSASCGECYDWMRHFVEGKFGFNTNYNMGHDVLRRLREACLRVMELEAKLAARTEVGAPDGYAVLMDDKASAPAGFWFCGIWNTKEVAEQYMAKQRGGCRLVPMLFASSPQKESGRG